MPINFKETLDNARIGRLQWSVAAMLTCVMALEGLNFQIAAYSAPALMALWHLSKAQLAPLLAAAMVGIVIGTLIGSWAGDRYGRKSTLVTSVAFFGLMTLICAHASNPIAFSAWRFLSGFGFGAAFPVATAMMSEWMPRRAASKAISIMTVGFPVGIIIGGLTGSWLLPQLGWRYFFVSVGTPCLLFSLVLLWKLPESLSYLILKGRHQDVHSLLARAWKQPLRDRFEAFQVEETGGSKSRLFIKSNNRFNFGLWMTFLCGSLATYTILAWLTVVLIGFKLPLATALRGSTIFSFSAIFGGLAVGWLMTRLGSRSTMFLLSFVALASALGMSAATFMLPVGHTLFTVLFLGLIFEGFCLGGLLPANQVLAANAYDTAVRSKGIGVMIAIGRVGTISSSFIGGAVLEFSHQGGFFALIATLLVIVIAGILVIDRHIPRIR